MKNYIKGMKHYAVFSGRATRAEYWLFGIVFFVLVVVAALIDGAIAGVGRGLATGLGSAAANDDDFGILTSVVILVHLIPAVALTVRRAHDAGISRLWVFLSFIPLVQLVIGCLPTSSAGKPATADSATAGATVERLEKIAALKAAGVIDDAEFATMKRKVINA